MKLIIAGSRDLSADDVNDAILSPERPAWTISEVVSGGARGADRAGEQWASERSIPVRVFPADWARNGKGAGPVRNREMAQYADALVAVWDGDSRGTADMIMRMRKTGKPVYIFRVSRRKAEQSL